MVKKISRHEKSRKMGKCDMGKLIRLGKKKDPEMIDWQELRVNIKISDMFKRETNEHKHDKEMGVFFLIGGSEIKSWKTQLSEIKYISPHSSVGKESTCNACDLGSIPGLGISRGEGNGNPLQYSCLENPLGWRAWQATVHGVATVRHATVRLNHHHHQKYIGLRAAQTQQKKRPLNLET